MARAPLRSAASRPTRPRHSPADGWLRRGGTRTSRAGTSLRARPPPRSSIRAGRQRGIRTRAVRAPAARRSPRRSPRGGARWWVSLESDGAARAAASRAPFPLRTRAVPEVPRADPRSSPGESLGIIDSGGETLLDRGQRSHGAGDEAVAAQDLASDGAHVSRGHRLHARDSLGEPSAGAEQLRAAEPADHLAGRVET